MTTVKNSTGTKAVKIMTDGTGTVRASFVQIYNNEESLIEMKSFASIKNAEKWSSKKLN